MEQPRILLAAYQCAPDAGSVSQIGWEWYSRLARERAVTLVTHVRNRAALAAAGAPLYDSRIVYVDTEWFAGPLYRLAKRLFPRSEHSVNLVSSLDYFLFDFLAWRRLAAQQAEGRRWSLVHRVTPVTLAAPSWLGRLGVPVLLGPLNCGLGKPAGFDAILRQESIWLVHLRELARVFDGLLGSTRNAARILTATRATLDWVPARHHGRCRMMLENGVDLGRFRPSAWPAIPSPATPLRVLFVGRLVPLKGVDMLLAAVAGLARRGIAVELCVAGAGPMHAAWMARAAELGIAGRVRFAGNLVPADVAAEMARCHVFCLPSVRESGGAVLLEAMACSRPVIAVGFGGPAEIVDDAVGRLLPAVDAAQVTADLGAALADVCANPQAWRRRGAAGRARVLDQYSWVAKVAGIHAIYNEILIPEARHV